MSFAHPQIMKIGSSDGTILPLLVIPAHAGITEPTGSPPAATIPHPYFPRRREEHEFVRRGADSSPHSPAQSISTRRDFTRSSTTAVLRRWGSSVIKLLENSKEL